MLKRILLSVLLCASFLAADELDSLLAVLESRREDEAWLNLLLGRADYHLVYVKAGYESNSYFSGRDVGLDQYNVALQAAYHFKGFTATAAGIIYPDLVPRWNISFLSAGYRLPLSLPLDIDLAYDRYIFHTPVDSLKGSFPNGFRLGLSHQKPAWGLIAGYTLLAGEGFFSQANVGGHLMLTLFRWGRSGALRFQPRVDLLFGNEMVALALVPGGDPTPDYTYAFGLLNTTFTVPLNFYWGDLDVALAWQLNLPRSLDAEAVYTPTHLISFSLGYAFSILQK